MFDHFLNIFFFAVLILKTKLKVETQKYMINIDVYREMTSTKMRHSKLSVSAILLLINEHYRKDR